MHSCIYEGIVTHARRVPIAHRFRYRLFMLYLDLDELSSLVGPRALISGRRFAPYSYLRRDHLFDSSAPLGAELRQLIHNETGMETRGPIRLLTQLRHFGYYMSPLNLYYVFDESDRHIDTIVAEVNNTPWRERHCYVLWAGNRSGGTEQLHFAHRKTFHVSPFMSMDLEYRWKLALPSETLRVHLANFRGGQRMFDAGMMLQQRPLSRSQLRRMAVRHPVMTAQITAGIYFHALRLWWKKCPFYTHPNKIQRPVPPSSPNNSAATPNSSLGH